MNTKTTKILAISGISGAGKTTTGKLLAKHLNCPFIDEDWFFLTNMPIAILSNGTKKRNYDSDQSIDLDKFNRRIDLEKQNNDYLVVVGFSLRTYFFEQQNKPTIHFHIKIPKELSFQARITSKRLQEDAEKFMFNEYVYPYYEETLKMSTIDYMIDGVEYSDNGIDYSRKSLESILSGIISKI